MRNFSKSKKFYLGLIVTFIGSPLPINARSIEEMAEAAQKFCEQSSTLRKQVCSTGSQHSVKVNPGPVYVSLAAGKGNDPALAVFNFESPGTGFIIVPSDENDGEILGYSDRGTFNIDSIPDGLKWMILQYEKSRSLAAQASYILPSTASNYSGASNISHSSSRNSHGYSAIKPLISTTWDQGAPYNNLTPMEEGTHCVTGCVATSMAQLLRYYAPAQFTSGAGRKHDELYPSAEFDFSGRPFSWELMRDNYESDNYTDREADEVARLMLACGVSVNMMYGVNESGAYASVYLPYALTEYFSMSNDIFVAFREDYSSSEWQDLVYSELKEGRPVNYSGNSALGGHSFICDGYDKDGLFHFNWGWSGVADGYYQLNMLDPIDQGIGGSGAFNENQEIIGGLKVSDKREQAFPNFMNEAKFVFDGSNGESDKFKLEGFLYYVGPMASTVEFGIGIRDIGGDYEDIFITSGESVSYDKVDVQVGLPTVEDLQFDILMPQGLSSEKVYNVYPCYRIAGSGEWRRLQLKAYGNRTLTLKIAEEGIRRYSPGRVSEHPEDIEAGREFTSGNLTYRIMEGLTPNVELIGVIGAQDGVAAPVLTIPSSVSYNEIKFNVSEIAANGGVFRDCGNISSLTFPSGISQRLATAPDWFNDLKSLKEISIPAGLTGLHASEFKKCPRLETIDIDANHPELEKEAGAIYFNSEEGLVLEFVGGEVEELKIKPETILIEAKAAKDNIALKSVLGGDALLEIKEQTFRGCSNLRTVNIGAGLSKIGKEAFAQCKNLRTISFGNSLQSIDVTVFEGDEGITDVRILSSVPPVVKEGETELDNTGSINLFASQVYNKASLTIPSQSMGLYRKKSPWNQFKVVNPIEVSIVASIPVSRVSLKREGNSVILQNPEENEVGYLMEVYSSSGAAILRDIIEAGEEKRIELPGKGLYLIRIGQETSKIIL